MSGKTRKVLSRSLIKGEDGLAHSVLVRLDGDKKRPLTCPPFFPASKNDRLRRVNGSEVWVSPRKMKGEEIQIAPVWSLSKSLRVNGKLVPVTVKEIDGKDELAAYRDLAQYHYRSPGGVGRRVPLIAKIEAWDIPQVAGFVELSSSMIVNSARKKILDAPFRDTERKIGWECWDWDTANEYNNALVRISRCVVYPELRGLGLAGVLTDAAVEYAKKRWHMGGFRPCFIEIIAEMLRYWPFVEKSGFVKVGETQGGGKSTPQALEYLLRRKRNGKGYPKGGIVSMYRTHVEKLAAIQKERKLPFKKVLKLLSTHPHKLSQRDWLVLHDIRRGAKPTYMLGLTPSAQTHLCKQVNKHKKEAGARECARITKRAGVLASVEPLTVTARVKPSFSKDCREIQEAFGIVSPEFKTEIVRNFSAEFKAGEVILITGASGVGKSILLNAIVGLIQKGKQLREPKGINISGGRGGEKARVACLRTPPRNKTPVELIAGKHSLDESMRILARAGLAEAHLFVRPSYALSAGQSYRLSLAVALAKNPDIVVADEFCEPLDEYTTATVCRKLRRTATRDGVCVVAATANAKHVLPELRPHRILVLSSGGRHKWIDGNLKPLA